MVLNFPKLAMMNDFSNYLKPSKHCSDFVNTANKLVSFIGRTFKYIKLFLHY